MGYPQGLKQIAEQVLGARVRLESAGCGAHRSGNLLPRPPRTETVRGEVRGYRLLSAQLIRHFERCAVRLLAVQFRLIPAELFPQFDDIAHDDERGRLETRLLGQCR